MWGRPMILKTMWQSNIEKNEIRPNKSVFRSIKLQLQKSKQKLVRDWQKSEKIDDAIMTAKSEYLVKNHYLSFYK